MPKIAVRGLRAMTGQKIQGKGGSPSTGQRTPTHQAKTQSLTIGQLSKETGYSLRRLNELIKDGMPHTKRKGKAGPGRPGNRFKLDKCVDWMLTRGLIPPKMKEEADKEIAKHRPEPPQQKAQPQNIDKDLIKLPGFLGAIERLKMHELRTAIKLNQMLSDPDASATALMIMKRLHSQQIASLRMGEFSALEYKEKLGEYCIYDDMVQAWERVALAFKNSALGIPTVASPMIRKYLKNPDDIKHIRQIINDCVRNILARLPEKCPGASDIEDVEDSGSTAAANS